MKSIFIFEDEESKKELFRCALNSSINLFCDSVPDTLIYLDQEAYDIIFLDGHVPTGSGIEVAKHIQKSINKDARVIIHSSDPTIAEEMKKIIGDKAEIREFGCPGWIEFLRSQ